MFARSFLLVNLRAMEGILAALALKCNLWLPKVRMRVGLSASANRTVADHVLHYPT